MNKLTINELINRADSGDKTEKYIEIYIKSMDSYIRVKKPDNELIIDALEVGKENSHDGDLHLLYNSIVEPNMKDTKLHDAYKVDRPYEIIDKVFTLGEISGIAKILLKDSSIFDNNAVSLVSDIKN